MIINIEFTSARGYKYETMRTEFDRNYRDEEQALIFVESEEDDFNGYFEVNISKNKQGKAISEGYVCEYASIDDSDPQTIYEDMKIEVKLNDFDDMVELANAELMQDGLQIVLEYDGECYWAIGTQIKATKEIKWFVDADFENEVRGHIYECWAHARALADSLKEGKQSDENPAKVWVVSIVEYKADENYLDSYTELYADEQQAKARMDEYSTKAIDAAPEHDGLDDGGELVGEQGYVTYFKNGDIAKVKYAEKEVK